MQRSSCAITRAITRALRALVRDSGALLPRRKALQPCVLAIIGARRRLGALLLHPLRTTSQMIGSSEPRQRIEALALIKKHCCNVLRDLDAL